MRVIDQARRLHSEVVERHLKEMASIASDAPPGCFVEVGVFEGGSAQVLYEVAERSGRTLHLFDTFTGIPCADPVLDRFKIGDFAPSDGAEAILREAMPRAAIHKGIFPETWPEGGIGPVAFVHADADQYDSTMAICDVLFPEIVVGGLIIFDDYDHAPCRGVKAAIQAFWGENGVNGARLRRSREHRMMLERVSLSAARTVRTIVPDMKFMVRIRRGSIIDLAWRRHNRLGGEVAGIRFHLDRSKHFSAIDPDPSAIARLKDEPSVELELISQSAASLGATVEERPDDVDEGDGGAGFEDEEPGDEPIALPRRRGRPPKNRG